jgi:DNA-binding transcriptional MerR regulator
MILLLKLINLPLADIKLILGVKRSGICTCAPLKQRLETKIGDIDQKITDLNTIQQQLTTMFNGWQDCGCITQELSI